MALAMALNETNKGAESYQYCLPIPLLPHGMHSHSEVKQLSVFKKYLGPFCTFNIVYHNVIFSFSLAELENNSTLNEEAANSTGLPEKSQFKLSDISYNDSVIVKRMFKHLDTIDFLGISVSNSIVTWL